MLVIDASALIELLLNTDTGRNVANEIGVEHALHAPDLIGVEMVNVLRRLVSRNEISVEEAATVLADFGQLGVEIYEHSPLLGRAFDLRGAVTGYDAMYVALAEGLQAPLLTCDAKLGGSNGHRATIRVVSASTPR